MLAHHIIHTFADTISKRMDVQKNNIIAASYINPDVLLFIIWACIKADINLVLLPPLKDAAYINKILNQTGTSFLVSDIEELDCVSQNIELENLLKKSCDQSVHFCSDSCAKSYSKAAFIFHTSGTTGTPKLVKVEYSKFLKSINCLFENDFMHYTINQTVYIVPPLFHSYGLSSMLEYTRGGSAIKIPAAINFLDSVKELTRNDISANITAIEGVPFFYQYLSLLLQKLHLHHLCHIGIGGDAIKPDVFERLKNKYFGITFSIRYGLTETPSVVSLNVISPPYFDFQSSGRILPIYDIKTSSSDYSNKDFKIMIKSRCLGSYMDNSKVKTDWFETGDYGFIKNNKLYITGRESSFLKNRGYRISPDIIESAIIMYKGVKDCIVYTHNDALSANIIVENRDTFKKQKLLQMLNKKLPEYYVPINIQFCDEIPRTISGKAIRKALVG